MPVGVPIGHCSMFLSCLSSNDFPGPVPPRDCATGFPSAMIWPESLLRSPYKAEVFLPPWPTKNWSIERACENLSAQKCNSLRNPWAAALQAITTYLAHFAFAAEIALVRLDGHYGDAAVIAQIILAGVHVVTRGRGYQLLGHPQIQRVLAHPPTTSVTRMNTGEVVELFDGGWLQLDEGLPGSRVIVARHPAPAADKKVTVGKRVEKWVYELFITTLAASGFLVEDVLDLYHGRGAFEGVLADEDVEDFNH